MEITKIEAVEIEKVAREADEQVTRELDDLQLTLVGGGIGTVILG